MLYRLVRPMRRDGTRSRYFVKRIPSDLRARVDGMTIGLPVGDETVAVKITAATQSIRVSLRTDNPETVRERSAALEIALGKIFKSLRQPAPIALTHRQATALAGEVYRAWASDGREEIESIELQPDGTWQSVDPSPLAEAMRWQSASRFLDAAGATDDPLQVPPALEPHFGPLVDVVLMRNGIGKVDRPSRDLLLTAFHKALGDAFASRERNAGGDYSPDLKAARFPSLDHPSPSDPVPAAPRKKVSLKGLLDDWWKEAKAADRSASTHTNYAGSIRHLTAFLKHDDASRIQPADIAAFKDYRLAEGATLETG